MSLCTHAHNLAHDREADAWDRSPHTWKIFIAGQQPRNAISRSGALAVRVLGARPGNCTRHSLLIYIMSNTHHGALPQVAFKSKT
jgi:hypothetical protein